MAFADCKTVFFRTLGVPMGPFVLPLSWRSGLQSRALEEGAEFHEGFVHYRIEESMGVMT